MKKVPDGIKKVAVICLLRSGDKWLLLERKNEPNKGLFTPVGGKLNPFETPQDAAKREVREETGFEVADMDYCGLLVETSPLKYNWVSFVYVTGVDFKDPLPECNEGILHWVSTENLSSIRMPETDYKIYEFVQQSKKFNFFVEYNKKMEILNMKESLH